jgi:uncharacterized membrane protein
MTNDMRKFLFLSVLMLVLIAVLILLIVPRLDDWLSPSSGEGDRIGIGENMFKAEVLEVVEEGTVELGDRTQPYQILRVEVLEGPWKGQIQEIDYGKRQIRPEGLTLRQGDRLLLNIDQGPDGSVYAFFVDYVRTRSLLWLLLAFVLLSILISGWQGARGLLGLLLSLVAILGFIIPSILQGKDPTIVSVLGGFVLLGITLYLIYGWSLKTHAAVLGLLCTLIFAGIMVSTFINLTRLTGYGNEDALFVIQQSDIRIDMRGLVLAGMMIGAMGALDDLVITQASVVLELYDADPGVDFRSLYQRAIRVGRDHVSAMINTLFMAYAGAALPTLVLFSLSGQGFLDLINLEFVAEEVVRTLAGSLGLIAAAPISTSIASLMAVNQGRLRSVFRPRGYAGVEMGSRHEEDPDDLQTHPPEGEMGEGV